METTKRKWCQKAIQGLIIACSLFNIHSAKCQQSSGNFTNGRDSVMRDPEGVINPREWICNDHKLSMASFIGEVINMLKKAFKDNDQKDISKDVWNKIYSNYQNRANALVKKEQFYCFTIQTDRGQVVGFEILESPPASNIYVYDSDGTFLNSHSTEQ